MKTLHKYILKEIFPVFFMGNLFFIVLLLLDKILDLADLFFTKNVPGFLIIETVVFYLPSFLVITIPTSAMMAVMIGFGRLSSDSEVTAMRAAGGGRNFFTYPTLVFGFTAFILGIMMSFWLMPAGSAAAAKNLTKMAKLVSIKDMKEKELYDQLPGLVLYADKRHNDHNYDKLIIIDKKQNSVISAGKAEITPTGDAGLIMNLENGRIVSLSENDRHSTINFENFKLNIPLTDGGDISFKTERLMRTKDLIANLKEGAIYQFELSKRVSMPFAAIIMSIFGMSLGIFFHRGGGRTMAIPATVAVVAIYNIMFFSVQGLAASGRFEPYSAAWIPNLIFTAVALLAYRRAL